MASKIVRSSITRHLLTRLLAQHEASSKVRGILRADILQPVAPSALRCVSLHNLPGHRIGLLEKCYIPGMTTKREASTHLVDTKTSQYLGVAGIQELEDFTPLSDKELQDGVANNIATNLASGEAGRLFAVVNVRSRQFKVTAEDIIVVKYDFPPSVGDRIRLEKVLAIGGKDFTLFGQPLLSRDVVRVEATVVEKTLTHNRVWFIYKRKSGGFKKFHVYREIQTMLLINSIQVASLSEQKSPNESNSSEQNKDDK